MEASCGAEFSRSTVSQLCKGLDTIVREWSGRDLSGQAYPFLLVVALVIRVRKGGRVRQRALGHGDQPGDPWTDDRRRGIGVHLVGVGRLIGAVLMQIDEAWTTASSVLRHGRALGVAKLGGEPEGGGDVERGGLSSYEST